MASKRSTAAGPQATQFGTEAQTVEPTELQDGQVVPQFSLELTKRGPLSSPLGEALSPEAAAQMVHPPGCPYGQRVSPPGGQRKGRRKKRRR